jgi:succinyl-diaminopimelate desuccinylase
MEVEKLLGELVHIKSSFPEEAEICNYLEGYLKERGFMVERLLVEDNRYDLLAERGSGGDALLFYGHMDTVPLYGTWESDPFTLTERGGKLYGLGARDMKGGLAAILTALDSAGDQHIKVLICVDEENISKGAWKAVVDRRDWFKDVKLVVSGDGATSQTSNGGVTTVTLGRRGRCVVTIDVRGLSSHGADPGKGVNAINEAARIADNAHRIPLNTHQKLGSDGIFVRMIEGRATSLSLPENASLELDCHFVPPGSAEEMRQRVEKFIGTLRQEGKLDDRTVVTVALRKRETPYLEPYVTSEDDERVGNVIQIVRENFGEIVRNYGSSVADDNALARVLNVPVVTLWPEGRNAHAQNEYSVKKSLQDVTALFTMIISNWK